MAPYKGLDIFCHFLQFYDDQIDCMQNFRNVREKFNFRHSSCRNIIEPAFGIWKRCRKILDQMSSYNFKMQTAVVVATMGIHNFLGWAGVVNEAFTSVETDLDATEVDLPDKQEQVIAKINALEMQ